MRTRIAYGYTYVASFTVTEPDRTKPWREAMATALYGINGFFVKNRPASAFRTSVVSPLFASAVVRLLDAVDAALHRPPLVDIVDIGAGGGELLAAIEAAAPESLRTRLRLVAIELAPRPATLASNIEWRDELPAPGSINGLVVATEWLDNVPFDIAVRDGDRWRLVEVDPAGGERLGHAVDADDAAWIARWWPDGDRVEVGRARDRAWATAIGIIAGGLALAVDYGHLRRDRPTDTVAGYRDGRQVRPRWDGSTDITAHVAMDSVAVAGWQRSGRVPQLVHQRTALKALGISRARPPLAMATADPAGYVRALADASAAGELTDPSGLGGHWWLLQPVGIDLRLTVRETSAGMPEASPPPAE
jgi:SAM-dependent MidA family methyltransferase